MPIFTIPVSNLQYNNLTAIKPLRLSLHSQVLYDQVISELPYDQTQVQVKSTKHQSHSTTQSDLERLFINAFICLFQGVQSKIRDHWYAECNKCDDANYEENSSSIHALRVESHASEEHRSDEAITHKDGDHCRQEASIVEVIYTWPRI